MTIDVLINEKRVTGASLELCKWFVHDPTVYEITKDYMQKVSLRDEVYDIMIWQMACAGNDGLTGLSPDDTPVRNAMQQLGFDLLAEPAINELAMKHYLYAPMLNTLTLGMYGMFTPPNEVGDEAVDGAGAAEGVD